MMVPRSYLYTSRPLRSGNESEKDAFPVAVRERAGKALSKIEKVPGGGKPAWMSSAPAATPSKPMVIPTRTRNGGASRTQEPLQKTCSIPGKEEPGSHDPEAVPTSVAALLAITSLPQPKPKPGMPAKRRSDGRLHNRRRWEECIRAGPRAMSASSPHSWGVLLSPPHELDLENSSIGSDTTLDAVSFVRSLSNESMPSLDTDYGSSPSASGISTPGAVPGSRGGMERKLKSLSSSRTEECLLDHPLLPLPSAERTYSDASAVGTEPLPSDSQSPMRRKSGFKSNLTASFALLRSAARSFSNFGAPAISRDEYLTRSLLSISPPFTDERRPSPSPEPPDPALRRYLNPITASPAELHSHHEHAPSQKARSHCSASIQLQTYHRPPGQSAKASAPPIFASSSSANAAIAAASDEPFITPSPRQREPRENSDFLRVIVLEMNMRRSGTMSETAPGKARMWLPARQGCKTADDRHEDGVPTRWIGVMS